MAAPRSSKPAEEPKSSAVAEALAAFDYKDLTLAQRLDEARKRLGGGIEKKGKNTQQDYSYVKAGDVSRAVYDALSQVGVYAIPSYTEADVPLTTWPSRSGTPQFMARLKVTLRVGRVEDKVGFTMAVASPETIIVETVGYGADSSDKGPYKAMTGGLKYALLHLLGLATDDDPEATHEEAAPAAPRPERRVGPQSAAAEETPAETTAVGDDPEAKITTSQSRLIFAKANEAGLKQNEFRSLMFIVTGKRSSAQLVSKEVDAILAGLADKDVVARAKQEQSFDATVGQTPDPTKDPQAEADRLIQAAAEATGGEVVDAPPVVTA